MPSTSARRATARVSIHRLEGETVEREEIRVVNETAARLHAFGDSQAVEEYRARFERERKVTEEEKADLRNVHGKRYSKQYQAYYNRKHRAARTAFKGRLLKYWERRQKPSAVSPWDVPIGPSLPSSGDASDLSAKFESLHEDLLRISTKERQIIEESRVVWKDDTIITDIAAEYVKKRLDGSDGPFTGYHAALDAEKAVLDSPQPDAQTKADGGYERYLDDALEGIKAGDLSCRIPTLARMALPQHIPTQVWNARTVAGESGMEDHLVPVSCFEEAIYDPSNPRDSVPDNRQVEHSLAKPWGATDVTPQLPPSQDDGSSARESRMSLAKTLGYHGAQSNETANFVAWVQKQYEEDDTARTAMFGVQERAPRASVFSKGTELHLQSDASSV